MSLCKGLCEPLSTKTKLHKEREAMLKDREICYAEKRANSWTLLRIARHPVGAGSCRLCLPVCLQPWVVLETGPVMASRRHLLPCVLGLCLVWSSPKKPGLKKMRRSRSLSWTAGDRTKSIKPLSTILLPWHHLCLLQVSWKTITSAGDSHIMWWVSNALFSKCKTLKSALINLNIAYPNLWMLCVKCPWKHTVKHRCLWWNHWCFPVSLGRRV